MRTEYEFWSKIDGRLQKETYAPDDDQIGAKVKSIYDDRGKLVARDQFAKELITYAEFKHQMKK